MAIRRTRRGLVAASILVAAVTALSWAGGKVPFPRDYRGFRHVKTTVIGPRGPKFERSGGIHHFYANQIAMEGYRTGRFPEGSVLIDDLLEVREVEGVITEGARRRLAVMLKKQQEYPETGGWGFEIFKGDSNEGSLSPQEQSACFECHRKGRDSVYAEFQK